MATPNKSLKRQQEDAALNRVLVWFGGTVLLELLVLFMNRFYISFDTESTQFVYVLGKVILGLGIVGIVAAAAGLVWLVTCHRGKKNQVLPATVMIASAAVASCCMITYFWRAQGVHLLYTLIPAAAVLALVYYLYQREFFVVALLSAGTLLATWTLWKAAGTPDTGTYVLCVLVGVLAVCIAILTRLCQMGDGQIGSATKKLRIFPKKATYLCMYITCIIAALVLLGGLLFGAAVAYGAIFLVVAWIFIMAVFYTVRLM